MKEGIIRIVITGCMRTATTFLSHLLNANEECVFLRDSFLAIFRTSWRLGVRSFLEFLPIRLRNVILFNLKAEMVSKGIDKLNHLQNTQFTTLEELFDVAMELFVNDDTKVFGVKITEEEHWVATLMKETDIKIIYMVRDLRDVLLSSANAFAGYNRCYFAKRWFQGITKILKINNPKIIVVRFEDLILNPERELERLSDFLGVKLNSNITELQDVSGLTWVDNSSFQDVKKLFDPIAANRWKRNLDSKEVVYGSVVYKKLMKKLQYEENKQPFFKSLRIKIDHNLPFPRTRSRIVKKIKELIMRNERQRILS
ncbi:MAG: sulfotransferase [Candidatus Heimdallarchaeota archaeon]|nr:sulfotransferase [Candidatus Heimdallarchaeota archaeon]